MGTKDFEIANCVRAMVGEEISKKEDSVVEFVCNGDDMTSEHVSFTYFLQDDKIELFEKT